MIRPPTLLEDTQPNPAALRHRRRRGQARWLLMAVIALTSCTLVLTLALLFTSRLSRSAAGIQPGEPITADSDTPSNGALHGAAKRTREVTIVVNGSRQTVNTALDNPLEILQSANIDAASGDIIQINGALASLAALPDWTVPAEHIEIRKAVRLTILDDGRQSSLVTAADTVGEALFEAGLNLYLTDEVAPPLETVINGEMTVTINRAIPVALEVDGVRIETRTNAETVDAALAELNSPLFGLDYVIPAGETAISENITIEIVRVTEEAAAQTETIPYQVRYQADADMNLDERAVIQVGQNGAREIRSRVRYENGVEVSRTAAETVMVKAPVDQVIGYGTKVVLHAVPGSTLKYWRKLRMYATYYHPAALGGDNITAIGAKLEKGIVAADPNIIPYRTDVFVEGYGRGRMADTGGPRSSPYWIDLGYSDEDVADGKVAWHWYVDVYLLAPAPAKINYLLPAWRPLRNRPDN